MLFKGDFVLSVSLSGEVFNKEVYKRLTATHGTRVWAYRVENGRFEYPQFKE